MNLSGILVRTQPERLDEVVARLAGLSGVEVHQSDQATGRIIVVQEAEDIHAELEAIKRIKALPHVILAEMVYHYLAEDEKAYDALPSELQAMDGQDACVPTYLRD